MFSYFYANMRGIPRLEADSVNISTIYGNKTSSYNSLYNRYLKAFGCPPMFTEEVDPRYTNSTGNSVGRAAAKTWFSNPAIFINSNYTIL